MSLIVPEFTSAAELMAHYAAVRKRTMAVVTPKPVKREVITIQLQKPAQRYVLKADTTKELTVFEITKAVADATGISVDIIVSPSKITKVKVARYAIIYIARRLTSRSTCQIGNMVDRDHSSVVHALGKVTKNWHLYEPAISSAYTFLCKRYPVKSVYGPVNNRHHLFNQYTDSVMVSA